MIRFGTGGIPFSAKEAGSIAGIRRVAELRLDAMELEFVRGVRMSVATAKEAGKVARELDVALSSHAPYYINLLSKEPVKVANSRKMILDTIERTHAAGGTVAVFHPGYYGELKPEDAVQPMTEQFELLARTARQKGWDDVEMGLEVTAKKAAWGSVEEIAAACRAVPQCVPVVDWAHLWVRTGGKLDAAGVLDRLRHWKHLHFHFAGAKKTRTGWADIHTPIGSNPSYRPMVMEVLARKLDCTFISETPDLEESALLLKRMFGSV